MPALLAFVLAAACEIAGCFAVWTVFRLGRSPAWLLPGFASLAAFAWLLTRVESPFAGRVYAAYGGVYILASLLWLATVERTPPDRWDLLGAAVCLAGAGITGVRGGPWTVSEPSQEAGGLVSPR